MSKSNKHKNEYPSAQIDFVIITALEEEREAMLSKLRGFKKLDKESDDIYTYYFAKVKSQRSDESVYQVMVACPLNMGPLNAAALSITLVQKWKPRFVILVGIACGVKGEVDYGDVMIATQVADYTLAKQEDGMRKVRWEVYPSGPSLLDSANNIDSKWANKISQKRPTEGKVTSVKGVIASGGDVISDDQVIKTYSESWPKLIGIEMESGGIAGGLHRTPDRPEFLMVKSVSDFGKDKHDPEVKPWRNYACHTAAAFTLGLIKSGPAQSSLLIQEKTKDIEAEKERKEAAERRWQYIQNHPLTSIDVKLFLKSSVGFDWFKQIMDDIRISFSREKSGLKLSYVLRKSYDPNTKEFDRKSDIPISSFWEMYELESGYWCKRIKPIVRTFKLIAGFDSSIPWNFLNTPEVKKLKDLAGLDHIGISVPPQLFQAGIEELIFRINGETFSFSVYFSDHALEFYHEMASTFYSIQSISGKEGPPMFFSFGFEGVQLLDMFHKQMMPEYEHTRKKEGILGGQSGPNGNAISFYPSIPTGFNKTEESKEYVFTISAPREIDYPKLVSDLEKAIEADETNVDNYLKLATIYAVQGRFQDVINCLTAAISKVRPNWELYGLLGDAYYKLGRYDDALVNFNTAASLAPDNPKVQIGLGLTLQGLGEENAALSHFENAVRLDPSNPTWHSVLSRTLGRLGRISDAIIPARSVVSLAPEDVSNIILLGILLHFNEQHDEALGLLEKAIQMDPNSAEAHRRYAQLLESKGQSEDAVMSYTRSIELKKDPDCYAELGRMMNNAGHWSEAESVVQEGLLVDADHYDLLIVLAAIKANLKNVDEAIELLERCIKLDPENSKASELLNQLKGGLDKS